jgi:hypothetical protein
LRGRLRVAATNVLAASDSPFDSFG